MDGILSAIIIGLVSAVGLAYTVIIIVATFSESFREAIKTWWDDFRD
jgi:ABC-type uncharacterized transport system permease subunit